jgi:site-specific recombinase XerD
LLHGQCVTLLRAVHSPVYRAVLTVMYGSGLRIGEAVKLQVTDVEVARMVLRVVGKGNKERLAPLSAPLYEDLRRVWTVHRHPQWLFSNQRGTNHVDPGTVSKAFGKACLEAGIHEKFKPHCLRHSFATRLMEEGVPVETVRILLGHTSIKTTQAYLHLTEPARKRINDTVGGFSVRLFD